MLVRLTPEEVTSEWGYLAPLVLGSIPPNVASNPATPANVLSAVMRGDLLVWGKYWPEGPEGELQAIVTTTEQFDPVVRQRTMVIYTLSSVQGTMDDPKLWRSGLETLLEYSKARRCVALVAYVGNRKLETLLTRFGAVKHAAVLEIILN